MMSLQRSKGVAGAVSCISEGACEAPLSFVK